MKTKEEVIKEAWGIHWNKMDKRGKEQALEDNGYCHKNYVNSEIDLEIEVHKYPDVDFIRPKSLQGIENNNMWIRINSEEDLPKEVGYYLVYNGTTTLIIELNSISFKNKLIEQFKKDGFTHYQQIIKPNKPLY